MIKERDKGKLFFFLFFFLTLCLHGKIPSDIPRNGLVGFWSFSGSAKDQSGNGYDGKVFGARLVQDRFGNPRQAYDFNGKTDYITTPFKGILGDRPRAVSFWAKIVSSREMPAITWGGNDMYPANGSRFDCSFNYLKPGATIDVSDAAITFETHSPVSDNKWHHYVFQFDTAALSKVQIYQDGDLLTHEPVKFYPYTRITTRSTFGVVFGKLTVPERNYFFVGQLDDIAIYDRALSQTEILRLYEDEDPVPDRTQIFIKLIGFLLFSGLLILLIIWLIKKRVKQLVLREKEKIQTNNKWYEQENRVLKAQMDPHFIFNSLNTILQFIVVKENEKAEHYLTKFSKLIRELLESNLKSSISLGDEIKILEKYLEIEGLRFNNAFNYDIFISNDVDSRLCIFQIF